MVEPLAPAGAAQQSIRCGEGFKLCSPFNLASPRLALGLLSLPLLLLAGLAPGQAAPAARRAAAAADLAADFAALARQRPWACAPAPAPGPNVPDWQAEPAACAWQDRLRMRRWTGRGGMAPHACVSAQALWWAWARAGGAAPAAQPKAWRAGWQSQVRIDEAGSEKRIVIIRSLAGATWSVTEWRWTPSERPATRRWQEGRWKLLAERAAQLGQPAEAAQGTREARMLRAVLDANLGPRAGEISGDILKWQADGLCLEVDGAAPGQQQLQLSYNADDSRLEQRAAMQLQLARRYPKAAWLTPFSLVPAAPQVRSGAKFYAIWQEAGVVAGQLWMPARAGGPLVRLRITTPLAPARPDAGAGAARQLVERELMALAARWAQAYE